MFTIFQEITIFLTAGAPAVALRQAQGYGAAGLLGGNP
jgi:hypothetical protein